MRAFVTGGRGFAGSWLVRQLAQAGRKVSAPEVDVTDGASVAAAMVETRPDWVFHLAALSDPATCAADPQRALAVNAGGTANVLAAARLAGTDPVVLMSSSSAVYRPGPEALTEKALTVEGHPYAVSKLAAEEEARRSDLRVIVARPFNHTGPGQPAVRVIPALAESVLRARVNGGPIRTGNLDVRRDLTDVRDTVAAYVALVERAEPGTYNVCSGTAYLLADLARELADLAGLAQPRFETDPVRLRSDDPPIIVGDPSKLKTATGWEPQIPMGRTLADVLEHARRERTGR